MMGIVSGSKPGGKAKLHEWSTTSVQIQTTQELVRTSTAEKASISDMRAGGKDWSGTKAMKR